MKMIGKLKKCYREIFWIIPTVKRAENNLHYLMRKQSLEQNILYQNAMGVTDHKYCDHDIIVSLTTYGKRIYDVALTIESIMEQTMKANRIVLWLDYSFQNVRLPGSIDALRKRGLEVKFCEDIRSYKKLIPSLKAFPNDAIITIDDDIFYEYDLLENLIVSYLKNPSYIYCSRYHKMEFDEHGDLMPYMQWHLCCQEQEPRHINFMTGVGGGLYPPHSLDDEVFNDEVFKDICQTGDDIWFNAMAIKKGTLVQKVYTHDCDPYIENSRVQDVALWRVNNGKVNMNDVQIKAVFSKYRIYEHLECNEKMK